MEPLYLFPSSRSIKSFFAKNYADDFLPQAKSMGEFLEFILRVDNKIKIPPFLRNFYLFKAVLKSDTKKLGAFADNFSQFLLNSGFFLKFYDELNAECIGIGDIKGHDIYAFYDEHLSVLEEVFKNYQNLLAKDSFYDHYFLENYKITFELLCDFSEIIVYIQGFLSCFELEVFKEVSTKIPIFFIIDCEVFNKEYYEKLFNIKLERGILRVALRDGIFSLDGVKDSTRIDSNKLQVFSFNDRVAEVGAIFLQIDAWLKQGIAPEQISVVLVDEEFVSYLKLFDWARNFNYAMGLKLSQTQIFRELQEGELNFESFSEFVDFIENLEANTREKKAIKAKFLEGLDEFNFALKYLENLETKDKILIFLNSLEKAQIDDVGGGRIQVIGILETRGIELEYVLIPEFNAGNVPTLSEKDIFLNTKIREQVGLPTRKNRESLQKYYYAELFKKAKEVKIFSINNDEVSPSRFLLDESIFGDIKIFDAPLGCESYFLDGIPLNYKEEKIIAPLSNKSFSTTSLQCFLTCKRKFYYQYILGFRGAKNRAASVGSAIHDALFMAYYQHKANNAESLYKYACEYLIAQNARENFDLELAKKHLKKTFVYEQKRLEEGWIPFNFETDFTFTFDFCKFDFVGRIDRVDKKGDEMFVLDYKYKKNLS
ncbi:MAG: PD-(D/E)XK nuclease family protein, partial [Helicobacter sp.]|nr:PD-(D/E)XK nuclease family protein [Helicobacter sp.]